MKVVSGSELIKSKFKQAELNNEFAICSCFLGWISGVIR